MIILYLQHNIRSIATHGSYKFPWRYICLVTSCTHDIVTYGVGYITSARSTLQNLLITLVTTVKIQIQNHPLNLESVPFPQFHGIKFRCLRRVVAIHVWPLCRDRTMPSRSKTLFSTDSCVISQRGHKETPQTLSGHSQSRLLSCFLYHFPNGIDSELLVSLFVQLKPIICNFAGFNNFH